MQDNQVVQKNLSSNLLNSHNLFGRTFGLLYLFLVIFSNKKVDCFGYFFHAARVEV